MIILGLIAFFVLLTLRMLPSYMDYYQVASALETLESQHEIADKSPYEIRNLLQRKFDAGYINIIHSRDVKISKTGGGFIASVKYESRKPVFGNVEVVMTFTKKVKVIRR
jgi:hypothetical protein